MKQNRGKRKDGRERVRIKRNNKKDRERGLRRAEPQKGGVGCVCTLKRPQGKKLLKVNKSGKGHSFCFSSRKNYPELIGWEIRI